MTNTRGRKCETRVIGIPECFDYKKMFKFMKNVSIILHRTSRQTVTWLNPDRLTRTERKRSYKKNKNKRKILKREILFWTEIIVWKSKNFWYIWEFHTQRRYKSTVSCDLIHSTVFFNIITNIQTYTYKHQYSSRSSVRISMI